MDCWIDSISEIRVRRSRPAWLIASSRFAAAMSRSSYRSSREGSWRNSALGGRFQTPESTDWCQRSSSSTSASMRRRGSGPRSPTIGASSALASRVPRAAFSKRWCESESRSSM